MLVEYLPRESAYAREVHPTTEWSAAEYLLASTVDLLSSANWQRGGGKGKRPKPLPRPGEKPTSTRYGSTGRSVGEMRRLLDEWHQN